VQFARYYENRLKKKKNELESHQKMGKKQKSGGFFYWRSVFLWFLRKPILPKGSPLSL
jgi:hypothetical protein